MPTKGLIIGLQEACIAATPGINLKFGDETCDIILAVSCISQCQMSMSNVNLYSVKKPLMRSVNSTVQMKGSD